METLCDWVATPLISYLYGRPAQEEKLPPRDRTTTKESKREKLAWKRYYQGKGPMPQIHREAPEVDMLASIIHVPGNRERGFVPLGGVEEAPVPGPRMATPRRRPDGRRRREIINGPQ